MATIADLPYVLLHHIMLLLVSASAGATDLARISLVCRAFHPFVEDVDLLKIVSFDTGLELKTYHKYQHLNGLLVKCSELGNESAQFLLGKVILLSTPLSFFGDGLNLSRNIGPCLAKPGQIVATEINSLQRRDSLFMSHFCPTSGSSELRLAHHQLVRVFLMIGSHHDIHEMRSYLKGYIGYFSRTRRADNFLTRCNLLASAASRLRKTEKRVNTREFYRVQASQTFTVCQAMMMSCFDKMFD